MDKKNIDNASKKSAKEQTFAHGASSPRFATPVKMKKAIAHVIKVHGFAFQKLAQ